METIKRIAYHDGKPRIVTSCRSCKGQPKLLQRSIRGITYQLECCPCQSRTSPCASVDEAIAAWERSELRPIAISHVDGVEVITKRPRLSLAR
jgi:hypothetical protein